MCEFAGGAIRVFVRMDVPRSARAVPSPFSVIVFAPGLPVEIQNKTINGDSLCAIVGNDLRNLRLRCSPLTVHKAKRPLWHHRRVTPDVGHAFQHRLFAAHHLAPPAIASPTPPGMRPGTPTIELAAP